MNRLKSEAVSLHPLNTREKELVVSTNYAHWFQQAIEEKVSTTISGEEITLTCGDEKVNVFSCRGDKVLQANRLDCRAGTTQASA